MSGMKRFCRGIWEDEEKQCLKMIAEDEEKQC